MTPGTRTPTLSVSEALRMCADGARFGDVWELLSEELREEFKRGWLRQPWTPPLADARGNMCERCGNLTVAKGGCEHCPTCGHSQGCSA